MRIAIDDQWRVHATNSLIVPMRASVVWGQMRDLRWFLTIDPLHARAILDSPTPGLPRWPRGAKLVLSHRLLGIGPDRIGRVLKWTEGCGFAISDLSKRGPRKGFPHVCCYELHRIDDRSCQISVSVRGRWTLRMLPRFIARAWLWWVMHETSVCLRREFTILARSLPCRSAAFHD